jgi:hypothetical protein
MIEEENKNNPDKPPKGIVGDKPIQIYSEESEFDQEQPQENVTIPSKMLDDISSFINKGNETEIK